MKNMRVIRILKGKRGASALELALVLPMLVVLLLGGLEAWMGLRVNNALVNMSREGANLASRTAADRQELMDALSDTASVLDMSTDGVVYVTRMIGLADGSAEVLEQVRWSRYGISDSSKIWVCDSWNGDDCNLDPPPDPPLATLNMTLSEGEEVYGVEVLYNYQPLFNFVLPDIVLHSATVL